MTPTRSKRVAVDYSGLGTDDIHIVVSREPASTSIRQTDAHAFDRLRLDDSTDELCSTEPRSLPSSDAFCKTFVPPNEVWSPSSPAELSKRKSLRSVLAIGTPPRPPRRPRRDSTSVLHRASSSPSGNLVPLARDPSSSSPSSDSISTISDATTPTPILPVERPQQVMPSSSWQLVQISSQPMSNKRDSAQRRLSALRGLVAHLDFNQPWSSTELPESEMESDGSNGYFWACGDPASESVKTVIVSDSSGDGLVPSISRPMPLIHDIPLERPSSRTVVPNAVSQDHGWPESFMSEPVVEYDSPCIDVPLVRRSSMSRKISSTPPRRQKASRTASDLVKSTPEPPRPSTRHRTEIFEVASSGYSKCFEPVSPGLPTTPTSSWRSSLSSEEVYASFLHSHGPFDVKRQEVMWEMCETEHAFVKSMRTVLRLFAIPLKTPQGKWIDGIPAKITELFDALESVAHIHGIVSAAQRDMRRKTEVFDVAAFLATFKTWVPKLSIHEWYLLRFEAVVQLVEDNVRDPDSVFGEFVRMQMKEEVLGSMSLGSMLLKPVQRLTKYPLFLKVC